MSDTAHVYMAYDEDGLLLYVGCTTNLEARMTMHKRPGQQSLWVPYVDRLDVIGPFPRGEAFALEAAAIEDLHPWFNGTKASHKQHRRWTSAYLSCRSQHRRNLGVSAFGDIPADIAEETEQNARRYADGLLGPRQDGTWRLGQYLAYALGYLEQRAA